MHLHHDYNYDPVTEGDRLHFAEIWPSEGLDLVLSYFPMSTVAEPANTWMALFTAFTASTVGATDSVAASYTEPSGSGYTRMTIASGSWGAQAATTVVGDGRKTTASQITFATATTGGWGTINGFMVCNSLTVGKTYFACNFDDTTAVVINSGDVIKVTPSAQYNH